MVLEVHYSRPKLYKKQEDAFFNEFRWVWIEASTKAGKTVGGITWLHEQAVMFGNVGKSFWWVAPVSTQARIAFERFKRFLPRDTYTVNETRMEIKIFNGSLLCFKSADKPDTLYGDDVWAVVIDEGSRTKEASWVAVRSTLTATGGKARIIGNVKGKKTWTYRLGHMAKANKMPNAAYFVITALDAVEAGVLAMAEIEDAKSMLSEDTFNELYMCIPAEDGANPFGLRHIKGITVEDLSHDPAISFGWDLAKYVDWTVGIGLDEFGRVCSFDRFQKDWRTTKLDIIEVTGSVPALVDASGVGDPIVEDLQREAPNFEGFKFTAHSKQQLMEGLAVAIQQKLIRVPQGVIIDELNEFEFQYTRTGGVRYTAPEGFNDDCVMALALAVRNFNKPQLSARIW